MKNIGVFYGGQSVEHDISVITALQTMKAKPKGYNFIPVYILLDGSMVTGDNLTEPSTYLNFAKNVLHKKEIVIPSGKGEICILKHNKIKERIKLDCALLCNHGHGGEDGSLQGLLELAGIPYTSCDVSSSAVCMDKDLTKVLLQKAGIPTPKYANLYKCEYNDEEYNFENLIGYPCIIKPARLGSSVGISICEDETNLFPALENAFQFDDKALIEEFLTDAREFCCAVMTSAGEYIASKITEVKKGKFYTFEEKYIVEKESVKREISKTLENSIKKYAVMTYKTLECYGVVRVDFLLSKEGKLYVNEVNTIPGSLAFNLFDTTFSDFLVNLISEAIKRNERQKNTIYKFSSQAIEKYIELTDKFKIKG